MNVKSSLYRENDETEIREIFTYAFPGTEILGIRPLKGGLFNTTYGVDYGEDGRQAVLRLGPVNRHLLMGFEQNLMSAESWTYKKMKGQVNITMKNSTGRTWNVFVY